MNRKLQHAMLALSTTAVVFTLLLLAGSPLPSARATPGQLSPVASAAAFGDAASLDDVIMRRHQRHSRALLAFPYFSVAQGLRRNGS